uniref:Rho guanine nucleotide exchange factor 10-like n=1 Tax=Phallusia mammillata TaxID=59560 RepID=A0A6F9D7G2_9ASCI|nr:rho guanine nucleotide exchange factor 10-like [Phallusia mammillata]
MGDFMRFFRRQKSTSKGDLPENPVVPSQSFENLPTDIKEGSNVDLSENNQSTAAIDNEDQFSEEKHDDTFRQPKGWRKSLRKLRWKKKEPSVSISSDNIASLPSSSTDDVDPMTPRKVSMKVNNRWSYSPDLCEDNVPGAKELRGTLERKLSVKLEMDETSPMERTRLWKNSHSISPTTRSAQKLIRQTHHEEREISPNDSVNISNHDERSICDSVVSVPQSLDLPSDLNNMSHLSQSEPAFMQQQQNHLQISEKGKSSPGLMQWATDEFIRQRAKNISTGQAFEDSVRQYSEVLKTSSSGPRFSADETPEEEEEPYDLQDIDDVLTDADLRAATLRSLHGQNYDHLHPQDPMRTVTGSLMRGRAGTQFERAADMVLENLDYDNMPVNHYYQDLNAGESSNRLDADSSENELKTASDDDVYEDYGPNLEGSRWDSQEFDSFTDTDDEKYEEASQEPNKAEQGVSKADRISKDIGKFKFWERTSVKKKNSSAKSLEVEQSTFLEVDLAKHHPSPQLPVLVPSNLDKNQLKRRNIVASIILSEQLYIESLQRLETDYRQALLDHKPQIIPPDMVEKIFYKIASILQCHRLFQIGLETTTANWDDHERIGGTFVASFSSGMVLECYGDFINNFTTAMDIVRKTCVRKPQFLSFLKDKQIESPDRLNLYGLMLKPVQRFPQFIMFVQDLLKYTPSTHPDCIPLQLALTELETLAERLNNRKAEDEDAADFRSLLENSNLKLTTHTKDGRPRKLVKQAEIRECEHNDENLIEKMKECLLVLTNDMLICCSITNRRPHQRGTSSTSKDMYKMKWRVGLDVVEVIDGSLRPSGFEERESLHSDFILLQQINKLVGQLQTSHEGISSQLIEKCINTTETKIRQAEQLASQPENSSFTVRFPGKSDTVTRTLVSTYTSQKDEWLETISRAKLANSPSNISGWYRPDNLHSGSDWKTPLFLRSLSAHLSYNDNLQVQCAHSFMPMSHVTLLWLSCAASTVLSIVSVYYITEDRVEKVHVMQVESSVQCMQHWNVNGFFSVWLGMESGCLLEYSTANGVYRKISDVPMPTMSSVMIMEAHRDKLYVGLLDGTLAMYNRPPGTKDLYHVASITVGTGPLTCLSPYDDKLWGCSGDNVVTIDIETFQSESSRSLLLKGESLVVNLVTRVGHGLWVNFRDKCTLFLYHLDSLERLQDMNLAGVIKDFVQRLDPSENISAQCHVTSMCSGHSQLLVGMSNGLLLAMPLPKLPGSVPKITGPIKISRHSMSQPLTFLFAPSLPKIVPTDDTEDDSSVFDQDLPPPVPERDDLDKTVMADLGDSNDNYINISRQSPPNGPTSPRASFLVSLQSPPVPPRPGELQLSNTHSMSSEKLPEDRMIYENMTLQSIVSPRKLTFVHWKEEKKSRQCPVIVACGEGYRHFGGKHTKSVNPEVGQQVPTIMCWKIV